MGMRTKRGKKKTTQKPASEKRNEEKTSCGK
jgi:hypothetical protein